MPQVAVPAFQIKITLGNIEPPIWRRLLVSCETRLSELHDIIQAAFGWEDYHLYLFEIGPVRFSDGADLENLAELTAVDARCVQLLHLVQPYRPSWRNTQFVFEYEYDLGDGWKHEVLFEDALPPDPKRELPVCTGGERACPPEDVGGVHRYTEFLAAIRDVKHPEYESYLTWAGGRFDPEAFDMKAINYALRQLK